MNFGRKPERARLRPDAATVDPPRLVALFAEAFAALDERPRPVELTLELGGAEGFSLDFEDGEPVFLRCGERAVASFRRRWLAAHPVPVGLGRATRFLMTPAGGNRVKVEIAGAASVPPARRWRAPLAWRALRQFLDGIGKGAAR